jgi:predicted phosphodiesterase
MILISDIHGNALALDAVIEREGTDANYLVLGDVMGLNGMPKRTIDQINLIEPDALLSGNHDKAIFQKNEGHDNSDALSRFERNHTLGSLTPAQQFWMANRDSIEAIEDGDTEILLTHSKPYPEEASGYTPRNFGISKGKVSKYASEFGHEYDYLMHGHTHQQYELDASKFGHEIHFINPGTLGYNGEYAVVDTDTGNVSLRSVEWDHEALKKHVNDVLPDDAPIAEEWL